MKNKLILAAVLVVAATSSFAGFKVGCLWQNRVDNSEAVRVDAGHYDPHTGKFTYGSAEAMQLANVGISEILEPAHKPKVHP